MTSICGLDGALRAAPGARRPVGGSGEFLRLTRQVCGSPPTAEPAAPDSGKTEAYTEHLRRKYGTVTIQSVGRDPESLQRAAGSMSGHDVIIAPNILSEMAGDIQTALYYERKIDYFFDTIIPQETARCAAMGLVFEPCGVVIHEDGSVTYICGCSDSPERVAKVNAINRDRDEKRAAQRELYQQQAAQAALARRTVQTRPLRQGGRLSSFHQREEAPSPTGTPLPVGTELFFCML